MKHIARVLIAAAATLGFSVQAQEAGGTATEASSDALRGPTVAARTTAVTLVERDFDGRLKLLEVRPEEAALRLLNLSEAEKAAAAVVLAQRLAQVSKLIMEHQGLFLKIQSARQAGDRAALPELMRELHPLAAPLLNPPLAEQLAETLTPEHAADLRRLVQEYTAALSGEQRSRDAAMGGRDRRPERTSEAPGVRARIEVTLLIREMAGSLRAAVTERRERTERIIAISQATPEQEAAIRRLVREFGEKTKGQASPGQRGELLRSLRGICTPEQRARVASELRQ